jgi:putative transposase
MSGAVTRTDSSDRMQMKRAYKFRAYPTRPQDGRAKRLLADHCDLYRPVTGTVKALRLKREHRRWYVIVVTECEPVPPPATGRNVGVDVGVARFLTTSAADVVANPRFLANEQGVIADLQRRLERARRGSGNRKRIRRQLAREWRKVRSRRRDFHHKTARTLVSEFDAIARRSSTLKL